MQVAVKTGTLSSYTADAIVISVFEDGSLEGLAASVDTAMDKIISQEITQTSTFKGKLGETLLFPTYGKIAARYVILVGLGKSDNCKSLQLRRASAAAIRAANKIKIKSIATMLHTTANIDGEAAARLLTEGSLLGGYEFLVHKTLKGQGKETGESLGSVLEKITIVIDTQNSKADDIERGVLVGSHIAEAAILARNLAMDSANHVTPTTLATVAEGIKHPNITCTVYEKSDVETFGMGAFLSVTQGSVAPPKFIHMRYTPANGTPRKKVALVGKGITFDSGGLSLKPPAGMETMKMDMTGAAVVISTMKGISLLADQHDLDIQVDIFAPCCENMPSGTATKPGDIVTSMNGKTIEINNTDAEGRLVLADALTFAQREAKPDELIDLATLTGACIVALGKEASGIMGTDDDLIEGIRNAGNEAGERFWPLPLFDEFKEMLKSDCADLINAGSKGQAGSSAGGMFLKEFIDPDQKWVHLDIAGPAWTDRDVPEVPKGATGVGVRTLLYYLYGLDA